MGVKDIILGNTAVVEEATSLLSTLSDRDGGYIWKKYSYTLPASDIYALSGSDGRIIYYSDAYTLTDGTYALVNPKSISIWASDTSPVAKLTGKYFLVATTSGTMMYRGMDNITTVLSGSDLYLRNVHVISNITSDVLTEIGYAVADVEDAYPDGGELDGFWYEASSGGGGEGMYAWKKNHVVGGEILSFALTTSHANPSLIKVTSNDIDLSTVDASFFVGIKLIQGDGSMSYPIQIISATQAQIIPTSGTGSKMNYSYDPSTHTISLATSSYQYYPYQDVELPKEVTEMGYVVSNDLSSYPENGKQDGFTYSLLKNIIDFGDVTFSSSVSNFTISHNLNKAPHTVVLIPYSDGTTASENDDIVFQVSSTNKTLLRYSTYSTSANYKTIYTAGASASYGGGYTGSYLTSTAINFTMSASLTGGQFPKGTYRWVAFAD